METKINILVLDDDPDIGTVIKMILEYNGYAVTVMDRPEQISQPLDWNRFQLLIIDILLSGMNGVDICSRIKNDPHTASIPVLMMSAHPNIREEYNRAMADDFLHKPFDLQELLNKVSRLVKKR